MCCVYEAPGEIDFEELAKEEQVLTYLEQIGFCDPEIARITHLDSTTRALRNLRRYGCVNLAADSKCASIMYEDFPALVIVSPGKVVGLIGGGENDFGDCSEEDDLVGLDLPRIQSARVNCLTLTPTEFSWGYIAHSPSREQEGGITAVNHIRFGISADSEETTPEIAQFARFLRGYLRG